MGNNNIKILLLKIPDNELNNIYLKIDNLSKKNKIKFLKQYIRLRPSIYTILRTTLQITYCGISAKFL